MTLLMSSMTACARKSSRAEFTFIRLFAGMNIFMIPKFGVVAESFSTNVALKFSIVNRGVFLFNVPSHFADADHFAAFGARSGNVDPRNMLL